MPRPMPLVEPVTSETFPASGRSRRALRFDLDVHDEPFRFVVSEISRPAPPFEEIPFGFRNDRPALLQF